MATSKKRESRGPPYKKKKKGESRRRKRTPLLMKQEISVLLPSFTQTKFTSIERLLRVNLNLQGWSLRLNS